MPCREGWQFFCNSESDLSDPALLTAIDDYLTTFGEAHSS